MKRGKELKYTWEDVYQVFRQKMAHFDSALETQRFDRQVFAES